jgi:Trypsin-like peptidase domain
MIIVPKQRPYPLSRFLGGLERAGRGVLRVQNAAQSGLCTGWLITDRLAVVPRFAVAEGTEPPTGRYRCWIKEGAEVVEAELVHLPSAEDPIRPALVELVAPQPQRALPLDLTRPAPDQQVVVLHYPQGVPQTQLSLGKVLAVTESRIHHDAPTEQGSSGAPVLSADTLTTIGMHVAGRINPSYNEAVLLAHVLDELRSSTFWDEIARHHNLADVGAAYALRAAYTLRVEEPIAPGGTDLDPASPAGGPDADLLAAALRWSIDPEALDPERRDRLRPLVGDPEAPRWSLLGDERRRLIKEAGSLATLREVSVDVPTAEIEPGQRAINRVLEGPPFDLAVVPDDELPYWLQTVQWFADVVPDLPSPAEVHQTLARRRVRSHLRGIAGPRLWGREADLDRLHAWYRDRAAGPMAITGIGGMGKSALVARFALDLPDSTVLLWLDFDRADLAPDDAVSVLGSLAEQMSVQLDHFARPQIDASAWEEAADALGLGLAHAVPEDEPALLVLDGFEIAQHVERYEEIWEVLGRLLDQAPTVRVVVSGRAPVPGLTLAGRPATTWHLTGLARDPARAWLLDRHVTDPDVLAAVLRVADGVPLVLKLAVRLVEAGGDVSAVPSRLPPALVDGYLYQRILDRVVDPSLRPLARDALVLRRLSAEMLPAVLGDRVPQGLDAPAVLARLSREMALVEMLDPLGPAAAATPYTGALRLRREVRTATLRLLELDDAERVREIDRRAAAWYASQDPADAAMATELVYHYLRLGDIPAAEHAWRDECAPLLLHAEEDIPEAFEAARDWLRVRTTGADDRFVSVAQWQRELEAYGRIRSALGRGLVRAVPPILREHRERSPESPLTVYDAWVRWQVDGDLAGAQAVLAAAGPALGVIGRERAILGALLAAEAGDLVVADGLLSPFDDPAKWSDRADGRTEALAVQAARVRLTVDLKGEMDLAEVLGRDHPNAFLLDSLRSVLTAGDLALPSLSRWFEREPGLESWRPPLVIPRTPEQLREFAEILDRDRWSTRSSSGYGRSLSLVLSLLNPNEAWTPGQLGLEPRMVTRDPLPARLEDGVELGLRLAVLAWRRWRIAAHTLFLSDVLETLDRVRVVDALHLAIIGTTAVFRGQPLLYSDPAT